MAKKKAEQKFCSNNVRKHAAHLYVLSKSNRNQRAGLIENAKPAFIKAVCECCLNSLHGNVQYSDSDKRKLRRHKSTIKSLLKRSLPIKKKKHLIIQSGGFLGNLLGPILFGLASIFIR